ncbi:MAG: GNAT family N-acetyltransferase [Coprobacillus sp.]|nr:GNAT family N-acetyltransferase [Coprobacillus sp.]
MKLVQPQLEELKYRKKLLKDKKTMAFNKSNGGIVDFNEKIWKPWYALWMNDSKHYYAYIYDETLNKYIGEVSYHFEEEYQEYVLNIIIEYQYRCLGKGKTALELLCKHAKENGLRFLCDDIENNNPAKKLFLDLGFKEVWSRENITMLRKRL